MVAKNENVFLFLFIRHYALIKYMLHTNQG